MTKLSVKNIKVKAMKIGAHEKLDEALYIWFRQQRGKHTPRTGVLLQGKAKVFYERLYQDATRPFCTSVGFWIWFMKQHNLRILSVQGEQASANTISACEFQLVMTESKCLIVIRWDCNPFATPETLARVFEKRAEGWKKLKDRVTISACANAAGTIKLPLLLIGKAAQARCFKRTDMRKLPVVYKAQKWVGQHSNFWSGFMTILCHLSKRN